MVGLVRDLAARLRAGPEPTPEAEEKARAVVAEAETRRTPLHYFCRCTKDAFVQQLSLMGNNHRF